MPRFPADIILRTMPPARSAMQTDAATSFRTIPGSLVLSEPAAAIMKNVRRSTVRRLEHTRTTACNNGRWQRIIRWADASTAGARIDLYLRPGWPAMPTLRTIDRHNEYDREFSIISNVLPAHANNVSGDSLTDILNAIISLRWQHWLYHCSATRKRTLEKIIKLFCLCLYWPADWKRKTPKNQ